MNGLHTRHVAAAMVAFCGLAAGVHGQCANPQWVGGEGFPGADGPVNATTLWDPDGAGPLPEVLVAGGDFQVFGSARASRIGTWDGSAFRALGSGMNASVRALTVFNGQLYAAGDFTQAGGQPASRIARWNGSNWEALPGGGTSDPIYALTVHAGDLYAGGIFTEAGVDPAALAIARWNGSTWSSVGSGATDGPVYTLASYGGELYAGGEFTTLGGSGSPALAKWNGFAWQSVGTGVAATTFPPVVVRSLDVGNGLLFVGGNFDTAGGVNSPSVATWNGSAWAAAAGGLSYTACPSCPPLPSRATLVRVVNGEVYAMTERGVGLAGTFGGAPTFVRLDAGVWSRLNVNGTVQSVAAFESSTIVGGSISGIATNIGRLAGADINPLTGVVSTFYAFANLGSNLIAAGDFSTVSGISTRGVAAFNGTSWSALGGGINQTCYDVINFNGEIYVSGQTLQRWDGSAWQVVPTPFAPFSLENFNGQLVATQFFGSGAPAVWRYNGSTWTKLGLAPLGGLPISGKGVGVANGQLYALGGSSTIVRWTGLSWAAVPGSPAGSYANFTTHNGDLHVAFVNGPPVTGTTQVYRLDSGGAWHALGPAFNGGISRLASAQGSLYAGGYFTSVGSTPVSRLARWDGTAWGPVAGGVNDEVKAIGTIDTRVAVGGFFNSVGSPSDPPLARFALLGCPSCYANCDGSTAAPVLNALDFSCFLGRYVAADPYANCDGSTAAPVLNALDFSCFLGRYVAGCP